MQLRAFLDQTDGMRTNGNKVSGELYDPNDPSTWVGVVWIEVTPGNMRVKGIDWPGQELVGNLHLSSCWALEWLYCYSNRLNELDVSDCTSLLYLSCYENRLTSLDTDPCPGLVRLDCGNNLLTSLNVTGCPLRAIDCSDNQLTSLDIGSCELLRDLRCYDNRFTFSGLPRYLPVSGGSTCTRRKRISSSAQAALSRLEQKSTCLLRLVLTASIPPSPGTTV